MIKLSKKFGLASVVTVLAVGCATTQVDPTRAYVPVRDVVYVPNVGVLAEAELGQTIASKKYVTTYQAVVIKEEASEYRKQALTDNRWSGTIIVPAGTYKKTASDESGSFYKAANGTYDVPNKQVVKLIKYDVGIFVPNDKNAYAVLYVYHGSSGSQGYEFGEKPVNYKNTTVEIANNGSYNKELVYNGVSKNTVSLSYREFKDGVARPAFTQDLKYDLNDGNVIGFMGARFQIIKASNTSIKYKLLKALD